MSPKRIAATLAALAAAALLTACSSQVGGQASPSTTGTAAPSSTSSPPSNPADPFAAMSPCATLDQAVSGQGFTPATPTIADSQRSCQATKTTVGDSSNVALGLSLQGGQKYQDNINNPSNASAGTVNARSAVEEREPVGSKGQCAIHIEVKPSSRAVLSVSSGSDTAQACSLAEDYAAKVEPLLPKNS